MFRSAQGGDEFKSVGQPGTYVGKLALDARGGAALNPALPFCGALAQLVERRNGIAKVSGSTPLRSTTPNSDNSSLLHFSEPWVAEEFYFSDA